jgi:hypothetical protein
MLTEQDKAVIRNLIDIAWRAGAVKSPADGEVLEQLRAKLAPAEEKK